MERCAAGNKRRPGCKLAKMNLAMLADLIGLTLGYTWLVEQIWTAL